MEQTWKSVDELSEKLIAQLEKRHPGLVTDLRIILEGDTLTLHGEVASEDCKGDAKRLLLGFADVFKVRNSLVVAAFLEAASENMDDYFAPREATSGSTDTSDRALWLDKTRSPTRPEKTPVSENPATDEVDVLRYPALEVEGDIAGAQLIAIAIDLTTIEGSGATPISLGCFPPDWQTIVVRVQLFAPWASEIYSKADHVTVLADGSSRRAEFRLRVSDDYVAGTPAPLYVSFYHGTRVCGHLQKDLCRSTGQAREAVQAPAIAIAPDASGPGLSIAIACDSGRQTWMWRAQVPGGVEEGCEQISLDGGDHAFAESLLKTCPELGSDEYRRAMAGLGERLWSKAPERFQRAYVGWRQTIGPTFPIQFVSDDPHVPWEMMKPDLEGIDHLFLEHPVARWPLTRAARRRHILPGGALLSFVPDYAAPHALPSAQTEGEWLHTQYGAIRMAATSAAFLDVLDGNHPACVGILHFAGHGLVDTGIADGGIQLEDRMVGVGEVHQSRVRLGGKDGTLVILNACETGAGAQLLGMNTGWGAAIAAREFGGLLAPLWEVEDVAALAMLQACLPALLDRGSNLGEALRSARRATCAASVSAFAYLAHGDVMATFARS